MSFMDRPQPSQSTAPVTISPLPVYDARDLTEGGPLAQITLDGQLYFLRITRAGKLILTK